MPNIIKNIETKTSLTGNYVARYILKAIVAWQSIFIIRNSLQNELP